MLLAFDPRLRRHVALKHHRLPAARLVRRRALQEARRCAAIDHPRVPRVFDLLAAGRELLLVLQYVPGCDLEAALSGRRLSPATALSLAADVAAALAAAHRQGIVHGDLKAGNVLIGGDGRALLTDFGVAVAVAEKPAAVSPAAWTPEHLRGEGLDARSDLFALGRLLYRLLSGFDPFAGEGAEARILRSEFPPLGPPLPPALSGLIAALLAADPAARPAAAGAVRRQLRALARELGVAGHSVARELADAFQQPAPAEPPPLPAALGAASRRRARREAVARWLQRPAIRVASVAVVAVLLAGLGWRLAEGPPCLALAPPRVSIQPGTDLEAVISRDWLQAEFAAALRARGALELTGEQVPGGRWLLTGDGRQLHCRPQARLRLSLECRQTLCLLGLDGAASHEALFPDAGIGHWRLAVQRLAAHPLLPD
ncbi:protein kinase [Pseudohaliea sp.]|uniref:protein kinase domain-containing protein n=1 Tax=Pseudohaliea sp. TaxID=2740289 RepID=UPI0032EC0203